MWSLEPANKYPVIRRAGTRRPFTLMDSIRSVIVTRLLNGRDGSGDTRGRGDVFRGKPSDGGWGWDNGWKGVCVWGGGVYLRIE